MAKIGHHCRNYINFNIMSKEIKQNRLSLYYDGKITPKIEIFLKLFGYEILKGTNTDYNCIFTDGTTNMAYFMHYDGNGDTMRKESTKIDYDVHDELTFICLTALNHQNDIYQLFISDSDESWANLGLWRPKGSPSICLIEDNDIAVRNKTSHKATPNEIFNLLKNKDNRNIIHKFYYDNVIKRDSNENKQNQNLYDKKLDYESGKSYKNNTDNTKPCCFGKDKTNLPSYSFMAYNVKKVWNKKKIYISLPITGRDIEETKKKCASVKEWLSGMYKEFDFITPFEINTTTDKPYSYYMGKDISVLLDCQGIILLDEWETSKGCRLEKAAADIYQIPSIELETLRKTTNFLDLLK